MRIGEWEFSWGRAILGAALGVLAGYQNHVRSGSALWWLAVPVLVIVIGWRHDSDDDDDGTVAD